MKVLLKDKRVIDSLEQTAILTGISVDALAERILVEYFSIMDEEARMYELIPVYERGEIWEDPLNLRQNVVAP